MSEEKEIDDSRLLKLVQSIAIKPEDAIASTKQIMNKIQEKRVNINKEQLQDLTSKHIVEKYSKMAAAVGTVSGLTAIVPGLGQILAATAGATGDAAVCIKFQIDMCYCLAVTHDYDITTTDAQHLSFLIAAGGAIEKAAAQGGTALASKAGVKMIQKYLQGAALTAIKEMFKKIGVTFTRKALEKALPFGIGSVIGGTANYALTKYVGYQAKKWFEIDRDMKKSGEI